LLRLYPRQLLGAISAAVLVGAGGRPRRPPGAPGSGLAQTPSSTRRWERFPLQRGEPPLRESRTRRPLLIFRNDGGSSRVAKSSALKTYSSGPRGGLEGSRALARGYGFGHLLMMDVGGTTTDVGVVADGAVQVEHRGRVAMGADPRSKLAAITSHGVGGSSVIRASDGALTVGPDSVGRRPRVRRAFRPRRRRRDDHRRLISASACWIPGRTLDGSLALDVERSRKTVQATVGRSARPHPSTLRSSRMEAAYLDQVRAGHFRTEPLAADTRSFAAFGGAGPMTVCGGKPSGPASARRSSPRTAGRVQRLRHRLLRHLPATTKLPLSTVDETVEVAERLRQRARRDMFAEGVDLDACVESFRLVLAPRAKTRPSWSWPIRATSPGPRA